MSIHKSKSGSAKRKVAAGKKVSNAAMLSNIPLLDTMFEVPQSSGRRFQSQLQLTQPSDLNESIPPDVTEELLHGYPSASTSVAEAESCTEFRRYVSDIGLWENIDDAMREYWAEKGSSECQNADTNFTASGVVFRMESFTRHCSLSYFSRIHTLIGAKIQRPLLCYSISKKRLFCFPCKLFAHPAEGNSTFITGFNNWKRGEEKISAHENGQSHRASIIAFNCSKALCRKG